MEYSKLKLYLKTNLEKPSFDFAWTQKHSDDLLNYIKENFDKTFFKNKQALSELRQAIIDFFEAIGHVQFDCSDSRIDIKIVPYTVEPQESEYVDDIIDIIDANEALIEYNYNGREDQIAITKSLKEKIFGFTEKIDEEVNKKELVRFSVREAFELTESDMVIVRQEQIFIKMYDDSKRKQLDENEKNTIAGRFNGLDEEELDTFYEECALNKENKDFFYFVAQQYVNQYFLDERIDNYTYERKVFPDILAIIKEQLINSFDHNEEFFKGFSGYIFRKHFKEVFNHIADLILHELSLSNQYMIEFLKYYSLNTVVYNGIRYRIPTLSAKNGLKWNAVSMLSIAKVYTKVDISRKMLKRDIEDVKADMLDLYINGLSPIEYQATISQKKQEIEDEITQSYAKRDKCFDAIELATNQNSKDRLARELDIVEKSLNILLQKRISITSKVVKKNIIKNYLDLEKEKDSLMMRLRKDEKVLEQNEEAYRSIKHALVKALISKKERL